MMISSCFSRGNFSFSSISTTQLSMISISEDSSVLCLRPIFTEFYSKCVRKLNALLQKFWNWWYCGIGMYQYACVEWRQVYYTHASATESTRGRSAIWHNSIDCHIFTKLTFQRSYNSNSYRSFKYCTIILK